MSNFSESKQENVAATIASSSLPRPQGKFIVKCVRRPLGSNPADFNRDLPHSSSAIDYLQDENSPTQNSAIPNPHADAISPRVQMTSGVHRWNSNMHTSAPHLNRFAEPERIPLAMNDCSPYATAKIPGCCTPKRDDRLDDHVYETIPGDELLYAEFLRMRELGLLPKRLNRIPDHPVHFIPFDPPALPARNNESSPNEKPSSARSRSRRPPVPPASQTRCVRKPMTDRVRQPMMRSVSWEGKNAFDPDMSVQSVPDKYMTNPGNRTEDHSKLWSPGDEFNYVEGVRQPPPKRRENFYLLLQNKQKRAEISQSLELETKLKDLGLVFDERFKGKHSVDADGYTTVDDDLLPMEHPRDRGQVFLKSTFV
ncbi:hypothetical protein FSP39_013427 [Pinctada imbricata]|uniref:Uncharacterized protein n=1 Tax=Pinctada imbricata TaxID=66713 RepID=A0AA89BZT4_PINIB|nr:hypothetical protein FSP39_013427 [Pinctada imbricata]